MDNKYKVDVSFEVHHSFDINAETEEDAGYKAEEKFINVLSEDYIGKNFHECFDSVELTSYINNEEDLVFDEEISLDDTPQHHGEDELCCKDNILFNFLHDDSPIFSVYFVDQTRTKTRQSY